jgi:hypothetical protein
MNKETITIELIVVTAIDEWDRVRTYVSIDRDRYKDGQRIYQDFSVQIPTRRCGPIVVTVN